MTDRRQGDRREDGVTSDLYEPLDTITPLHELDQQMKYAIKYAEKRESIRRTGDDRRKTEFIAIDGKSGPFYRVRGVVKAARPDRRRNDIDHG